MTFKNEHLVIELIPTKAMENSFIKIFSFIAYALKLR